jgi:hypothetical protein
LDISINIYWIYKFKVFRDRDDTIEQVWEPKRAICMFRDQDDITEQVWGPKRAISESSDRDDTDRQVWRPKRSIYEFRDRGDTIEQIRGPLVDFTLHVILFMIISLWLLGSTFDYKYNSIKFVL